MDNTTRAAMMRHEASGGPAVEILRNIDVEIAALCVAGIVLLQLVFELRRIYNQAPESPPRVVYLDGMQDPATEPGAPATADEPGAGRDDGA